MNKAPSPEEQVDNIIDLALAEDLGHGDITSEALIPNNLEGKASILIKERGILAGVEVAKKVFLPSIFCKDSVALLPKQLNMSPRPVV